MEGSLNAAKIDLVVHCRFVSVSLFKPTIDRFPLFKSVVVADFDFFVLVAMAVIGSNSIQGSSLDFSHKRNLLEKIHTDLLQIYNDALEGFEDCNSFFLKNYKALEANSGEREYLAANSIGIWLFRNSFGRPPTGSEDYEIVRDFGGVVVFSVFDYLYGP